MEKNEEAKQKRHPVMTNTYASIQIVLHKYYLTSTKAGVIFSAIKYVIITKIIMTIIKG